MSNPNWVAKVIAEYGDQISVGLDVRGHDGWPPAAGPNRAASYWTCSPGSKADGCHGYVVTDVNKDGMLTGPNLDLLQQVCALTERPVIASGGVSGLDDLRRDRPCWSLGVEGAIVGKALYARAFTLEQALEAVRG